MASKAVAAIRHFGLGLLQFTGCVMFSALVLAIAARMDPRTFGEYENVIVSIILIFIFLPLFIGLFFAMRGAHRTIKILKEAWLTREDMRCG